MSLFFGKNTRKRLTLWNLCHIIAVQTKKTTKKGNKMQTLDNLYDLADSLEKQLDEVKEQIQVESARIAKTVTVKKRKATTVLTNENGKSIVIGKNEFNRFSIWEYNGKRGKLLHSDMFASLNRIKIGLALGTI